LRARIADWESRSAIASKEAPSNIDAILEPRPQDHAKVAGAMKLRARIVRLARVIAADV
jgi:hypothetical protein